MDKVWITIEHDGKTVFNKVKEYNTVSFDFHAHAYSKDDGTGKLLEGDVDTLTLTMTITPSVGGKEPNDGN